MNLEWSGDAYNLRESNTYFVPQRVPWKFGSRTYPVRQGQCSSQLAPELKQKIKNLGPWYINMLSTSILS